LHYPELAAELFANSLLNFVMILPTKATLVKHPRSQFWQAEFYVWSKEQGKWQRTMKSTKATDKGRAQSIGDEFQSFALAASGHRGYAALSREFVLDTLNHILRIGGHPTVEITRKWGEYSQEWLGLQEQRVEERSLESYTSHVRQFTRWMGEEADMSMNLITGTMMQAWYFDMLDEGKKAATVNNNVKTLQAVFDRARAEGFCPRNPAELILRQYSEKDIREPFSLDDVAQIITHLGKHKEHLDWLTVSLLGLCTGQRLQDCATAAWKHFKAKNGMRVWTLTQGKTGTTVQIPIVEPLESHLQRLATQRPGLLLAPSLADTPSGSPTGLSVQFSTLLDAAGLKREKREKVEGSKGQSWTNKTFHSFRHTTNSLLANAGISDDIRRKITGHTTTKMNTIYTHMEAKVLQEALQRAVSDQFK
jgi:integrase